MIVVADPERGGAGRQPLIWQISCQKLHEIERNWTERGRASLAPPLDPTMDRTGLMKVN